MIDRYSRPEMQSIWTEEAQFQAWLDVELAACKAWSRLGHIPEQDVHVLYRDARFDIQRIKQIEQATRHDVVAFTRAVSESLGDEKKWIHYGLTSTDVVDTAWGVRLKKANRILKDGLDRLSRVLAQKAHAHRYSIMIGRTHGVHAEPTTFGLKCALWYAEVQRHLDRFQLACSGVEVGKLSGAVGTFAHIPPEIEEWVCEDLGLQFAPVSTQTLQRDRHAFYVAVLSLIGTTLEKMAVEVRHLQKSETREVEERFFEGQKGSSAMPHKRNPVGSENISGCARVLRGYMLTAFENVPLWHERDISHSASERIILPDATLLLDYMLDRFSTIIEELVVNQEQMKINLEATYGLVYSQCLLLRLIEAGLSREQAYDMVQPLAMQSWQEQTSFKALVRTSTITQYLDDTTIDEAFDPAYHLRQVDRIFTRVGL